MTDADHFYLSRLEIQTLSERLRELAGWVAEELDTTISRTVAFSDESDIPHRSDDRVLVFNAEASDTAAEVLGTLRVWTEYVCTARKLEWPGNGRIPFYAKWFDGHLVDLALTDQAGSAMREITDSWKRAKRAIDRPAAKEFAGPCQSDAPGLSCDGVYVKPKTDVVKCRTCSVICDVAKMHEQMAENIKDRQYLAVELSTALTLLTGDTVPLRTVRNWINRDKITSSGTDLEGRKLYRLNDALDVMEKTNRRRSA
ncbi:hypothetical protein [Rhodococcoides fascians]|uniref:hypothetical protein n=1 Tax=Rhodococcoides fascians TaxID=1828 RepID=UPI00117BC7E7|nr:hypothetical protein [Rhodococcus fascians]